MVARARLTGRKLSSAVSRRRTASPDYSRVTAIEGRALRSEDNEPVPGSGLQTELLERTSGKNASVEPSTREGIEADRLCVFAPPGSPLDRHSLVIFTRTVNNAG